MAKREIDCEGTDFMVCPWCGYVERDSWEYTSDDGEAECASCGEPYTYSRTISITYSTSKPETASRRAGTSEAEAGT